MVEMTYKLVRGYAIHEWREWPGALRDQQRQEACTDAERRGWPPPPDDAMVTTRYWRWRRPWDPRPRGVAAEDLPEIIYGCPEGDADGVEVVLTWIAGPDVHDPADLVDVAAGADTHQPLPGVPHA